MMYPPMSIEPTNKFILEVVKALLDARVPHKAILASIERLEQTVIAEDKKMIEDRRANELELSRVFSGSWKSDAS